MTTVAAERLTRFWTLERIELLAPPIDLIEDDPKPRRIFVFRDDDENEHSILMAEEEFKRFALGHEYKVVITGPDS